MSKRISIPARFLLWIETGDLAVIVPVLEFINERVKLRLPKVVKEKRKYTRKSKTGLDLKAKGLPDVCQDE
jgi:hypothetical protein